MSENLKLQIAVLITNTICLALWITIAIIFNKWWVALFSLLFINFIENEENRNYRGEKIK